MPKSGHIIFGDFSPRHMVCPKSAKIAKNPYAQLWAYRFWRFFWEYYRTDWALYKKRYDIYHGRILGRAEIGSILITCCDPPAIFIVRTT